MSKLIAVVLFSLAGSSAALADRCNGTGTEVKSHMGHSFICTVCDNGSEFVFYGNVANNAQRLYNVSKGLSENEFYEDVLSADRQGERLNSCAK